MTYEIATRDYDRTPEGNIPQYYEEEFNSDLEAICHVYTWGDTDGMTEEEIQDWLVEEGEGNEDGSPVTISQIEDRLNKRLDPSDGFTFYVRNLNTGKYIYENDYCDIDEWCEEIGYEGDEDDFESAVMDIFPAGEENLGSWLASTVIEYKHNEMDYETLFEDYFNEELENLIDAGDDPVFRFLARYVLEEDLAAAFEYECSSREEAMDMMKACMEIAPHLDTDAWALAMDEVDFDED